jgi:hypothetical protein
MRPGQRWMTLAVLLLLLQAREAERQRVLEEQRRLEDACRALRAAQTRWVGGWGVGGGVGWGGVGWGLGGVGVGGAVSRGLELLWSCATWDAWDAVHVWLAGAAQLMAAAEGEVCRGCLRIECMKHWSGTW